MNKTKVFIVEWRTPNLRHKNFTTREQAEEWAWKVHGVVMEANVND